MLQSSAQNHFHAEDFYSIIIEAHYKMIDTIGKQTILHYSTPFYTKYLQICNIFSTFAPKLAN